MNSINATIPYPHLTVYKFYQQLGFDLTMNALKHLYKNHSPIYIAFLFSSLISLSYPSYYYSIFTIISFMFSIFRLCSPFIFSISPRNLLFLSSCSRIRLHNYSFPLYPSQPLITQSILVLEMRLFLMLLWLGGYNR